MNLYKNGQAQPPESLTRANFCQNSVCSAPLGDPQQIAARSRLPSMSRRDMALYTSLPALDHGYSRQPGSSTLRCCREERRKSNGSRSWKEPGVRESGEPYYSLLM